jgi:hypothetical protein
MKLQRIANPNSLHDDKSDAMDATDSFYSSLLRKIFVSFEIALACFPVIACKHCGVHEERISAKTPWFFRGTANLGGYAASKSVAGAQLRNATYHKPSARAD